MQQDDKKMYIEAPITVKTYDIDFMQIAHNSVYVKWFEDLRMEILNKYFPLQEMLKDNCSPILSETHIRYIRPIVFGSHPIGKAWLSHLDRGKWEITMEIEVDGKKYAEGRQSGYYLNMTTNRICRFPQSLLEMYNKL